MPKHVLEDDEEVLQRHMIGIEHSSILQRRFDEFLDNEFRYVDEIASLDDYRVAC